MNVERKRVHIIVLMPFFIKSERTLGLVLTLFVLFPREPLVVFIWLEEAGNFFSFKLLKHF